MHHVFERAIQMGEKMSIKSKKVLLSFTSFQIDKIQEFGESHEMHTDLNTLRNGTICKRIVRFVLSVYADPDVQAYLKSSGGTFFDLVRRALKSYISDKNRLR